MATTKTLTPTNQAITLTAFTEKPDNRTNVTNDDKLADAVNALNSKFTKNLINVDIDFTSQTTVSYTGASITIPANSFYAFQATAVYATGEPLEIYICSSSTQLEDFRTLAGGTIGACSLCGYTPSETTYYVWAKYRNSSTNRIRIRGWYENA